MNSIVPIIEVSEQVFPLRVAFLKWQCRVRQIAMRDGKGRPNLAITPTVLLQPQNISTGNIVTILCKLPSFSQTPELKHIFKSNNEPARRREKILQLLSETYYQKHQEFSDMLTATFKPKSLIAGSNDKSL